MKRSKILIPIIFLIILALTVVTIITIVKQRNNIDSETLKFPVSQDEFLYGIVVNDLIILKNEVREGATFSSLFQQYGVSMQDVDKIAKLSDSVFDVRKLRSGNTYTAILSSDSSKLEYLVYEHTLTSFVVFGLQDSMHVYQGEKEVVKRDCVKSGEIQSSLWNAMMDIGASPQLAMDLSDVYQWSIDFFGLQKGDNFKVYYTELWVDSIAVGIERIYAASFNHGGKTYMAYYFPTNQDANYYDEKGLNLKKAFLKAPLKFSRISSRFSNSRLHPVLKIRRPHHGVDYAAPVGTPVQSIGAGTVISKSYAGGAGNMVKIRHNNGFESAYLHLSKYGQGIAAGSHVSQGQVIGYVGSSGLSTGPHLDFRVYKNGTPIDPLKVVSPPSEPVSKEKMEDFKKVVTEMNTKLKI